MLAKRISQLSVRLIVSLLAKDNTLVGLTVFPRENPWTTYHIITIHVIVCCFRFFMFIFWRTEIYLIDKQQKRSNQRTTTKPSYQPVSHKFHSPVYQPIQLPLFPSDLSYFAHRIWRKCRTFYYTVRLNTWVFTNFDISNWGYPWKSQQFGAKLTNFKLIKLWHSWGLSYNMILCGILNISAGNIFKTYSKIIIFY